jgi:hypothetical protein
LQSGLPPFHSSPYFLAVLYACWLDSSSLNRFIEIEVSNSYSLWKVRQQKVTYCKGDNDHDSSYIRRRVWISDDTELSF